MRPAPHRSPPVEPAAVRSDTLADRGIVQVQYPICTGVTVTRASCHRRLDRSRRARASSRPATLDAAVKPRHDRARRRPLPAGSQSASQAKPHRATSQRPYRPASSRSARPPASTRSGVAGASRLRADPVVGDAGDRVARARRTPRSPASAAARRPPWSGGSCPRGSRPSPEVDVEDCRAGRRRRGSCRSRARGSRSRPSVVPHQLLGGQPAHALDEAALDLADVDRRVERAADVVQDVDAQHAATRRSACRSPPRVHGRAVGEVVERPALVSVRGPSGSSASCRSRSPTAGRARGRPRRPARRSGISAVADAHAVAAETRPRRRRSRYVSAAKAASRSLDRARRGLRRHAVEVGAGRGGGGRGVGHLAGVGGGDLARASSGDAELVAPRPARPWCTAPGPSRCRRGSAGRAVGVDVHQRAGLVEMGGGEGDAELHRRQRDARA